MKEFVEGLKEVLRTSLMALIPVVILSLQQGNVDWKAIGIAATIALLSGVDKWLHKLDTGVAGNGLTGV